MSSIGSKSGQAVTSPQYRNSNTARIQALLVSGMDTWREGEREKERRREMERERERKKREMGELYMEGKIEK